jgi:hypothetical protein
MRSTRIIALLLLLPCCATAVFADIITDPRMVIAGDEASIGVGTTFTFYSDGMGGGYYGDSSGTTGNGDIGDPQFNVGLYNATYDDWTRLLITSSAPDGYSNSNLASFFTIQSDLFWSADVWLLPNTGDTRPTLNILFWGTGPRPFGNEVRPGILGCSTPAGANVTVCPGHFYIDLNDVRGIDGGGWLVYGSPMIFSATASTDTSIPDLPEGGLRIEPLAVPPNPVPEPGSFVLLLGGLGLLATGFRRMKN